MPAYPSYIPARDADCAAWATNFDTLLTAAPATYGLSAPDAVAVAAVVAPFISALTAATDPATRTPGTVAAKDAARAAMEAVVRPYAVRISKNPAVTNEDKTAIGVTVPSTTPTPIPAPAVAPELGVLAITPLNLKGTYKAAGASNKAKPFGVIGVEIAIAIGVAHTVDPNAATYVKTVTKSPFNLSFSSSDQGKNLTVFGRFVTRGGPGGEAQSGPWSAPLQTFVA